MAVPNTDTFSLQDVQAELGGVNDDLVECFANANTNLFDSDYEGSKNSLLNFRNYGGYTKFYVSIVSGSATTACGYSPTILKYHDGTGDLPVIGDRVYSNNDGSGFSINDNWLSVKTFAGVDGLYSLQGNSGGTIIDENLC